MIAGVIVRLSYVEVRKNFAGVAVASKGLGQGQEELEHVRGEMLQAKAETGRVNKELERVRREMLRAKAEAEGGNRGGARAKQLVEMEKEVKRSQQALSAAQQALEEERQKVAALIDEADRYRKDAAEVRRRRNEWDKMVGERDALRLLNDALTYTHRKRPGDEKRAEAAYRKAVQIARARNIRNAELYNAFAVFLQGQKRLEEAEKFYQMALEVNPSYGRALFNLGTLYEVRGDLVRGDFKHALEKYKAAGEAGEKQGRENYLRLRSVLKQ